jgi:hypothetical protein
MRPEDVYAMLRADPFQPFRVRLTTGKSYEVRYPNLAMATQQLFIVGFADPASNGRWAEDCVWINWPEIKSVEKLTAQAAAA